MAGNRPAKGGQYRQMQGGKDWWDRGCDCHKRGKVVRGNGSSPGVTAGRWLVVEEGAGAAQWWRARTAAGQIPGRTRHNRTTPWTRDPLVRSGTATPNAPITIVARRPQRMPRGTSQRGGCQHQAAMAGQGRGQAWHELRWGHDRGSALIGPAGGADGPYRSAAGEAYARVKVGGARYGGKCATAPATAARESGGWVTI